MKTWYILEEGSSTDGRGTPRFYRRTLQRKTAMKFLKDHQDSPYSFCRVKAYCLRGEVICNRTEQLEEIECS